MEGRPVAREMAGGRAARVARPSQRPAPHHLQDRRRALASRAQEPGPDDARGPAQGEYRRRGAALGAWAADRPAGRSEEHTSELQSLMRISYAVFCLKKKNHRKNNTSKELTLVHK